MLLAADACSGLEQIARQECAPHETEPEKAATSYERKYLIQGRVIYKATYIKKQLATNRTNKLEYLK
jgi:hypothetical protein